jgi:hypothetical protein
VNPEPELNHETYQSRLYAGPKVSHLYTEEDLLGSSFLLHQFFSSPFSRRLQLAACSQTLHNRFGDDKYPLQTGDTPPPQHTHTQRYDLTRLSVHWKRAPRWETVLPLVLVPRP